MRAGAVKHAQAVQVQHHPIALGVLLGVFLRNWGEHLLTKIEH